MKISHNQYNMDTILSGQIVAIVLKWNLRDPCSAKHFPFSYEIFGRYQESQERRQDSQGSGRAVGNEPIGRKYCNTLATGLSSNHIHRKELKSGVVWLTCRWHRVLT